MVYLQTFLRINMLVEQREHYIALFDRYQSLLTAKQVEYFQDYYFHDYSFAEIAENNGVSRNAVFDQVKKVLQLLEHYETNLKLNYLFQKLFTILESEDIQQDLKTLLEELK